MKYQCWIFNPVMTSPFKVGQYDNLMDAIARISSDLGRMHPNIYGKVLDAKTGEVLIKIENVDQITFKADRFDVNNLKEFKVQP